MQCAVAITEFEEKVRVSTSEGRVGWLSAKSFGRFVMRRYERYAGAVQSDDAKCLDGDCLHVLRGARRLSLV